MNMKAIAIAVLVLFAVFVVVPPQPAQASDAGLIAATVIVALGVPIVLFKLLADAVSKKPEAEKKSAPEEKKPATDEDSPGVATAAHEQLIAE